MLPPKKPDLISVTTINEDGSRYFLHPADVKGWWKRLRTLVGFCLIAIYVLLPWIQINGNPAVFLDVEHRMFHLFGLTLVPQDLWVMFFAITGLGFSLFCITSLLGRIWCGWACPYTVFLDHIYRRIERWIDGDAQARRSLEKAPWNRQKIIKRAAKHTIYLMVSAVITHVFLSYFVSIKRLYLFIDDGPLAHAATFGFVSILTLILWFCFGYFREQFCIIMCPYGRLQSALTDDDTITIGYDAKRGEPRGARGKTEGACIDCRRCVQVCPTGIDIRNGLQLECIGCTACIDACDDIMTKIDRPKGLIRYDSLRSFNGGKRKFLRPRIYAYALLAALGLTALITVASQKAHPCLVTISRTNGVGFSNNEHSVNNIYKIRFMNKRNIPVDVSIKLASDTPSGYQISGANPTYHVGPLQETSMICVVVAPIGSYIGQSEIKLDVHSNPGDFVVQKSAKFLGPPLSQSR